MYFADSTLNSYFQTKAVVASGRKQNLCVVLLSHLFAGHVE